MSSQALVRVVVIDASFDTTSGRRLGACRLRVQSARALPIADHEGNIRLGGIERAPRGVFPCRLLRPYRVVRIGEDSRGVVYAVTVDLSDEGQAPATGYSPPGACLKSPNEPIEVVCKRIAGIFGRICEEFRPPSVVVDVDTAE